MKNLIHPAPQPNLSLDPQPGDIHLHVILRPNEADLKVLSEDPEPQGLEEAVQQALVSLLVSPANLMGANFIGAWQIPERPPVGNLLADASHVPTLEDPPAPYCPCYLGPQGLPLPVLE